MSDAVGPDMMRDIGARLDEIEAEDGVRILLAVESGSRAWGFHSPDSDYDVRFLYARPLDWHYRLDATRDVIERPIDAELDISGWDLGKALKLMLGSNAALSEWLQSPIVYRADPDATAALRTLAQDVLDRRAMTWHYKSMLTNQIARHMTLEGRVKLKRYFYALRPSLTLRWMRLHDSAIPPMDMSTLCDGCDLPKVVARQLDDLTARKRESHEAASAEVSVPLLDELIASELSLAEDWLSNAPDRPPRDAWDVANRLHLALSQGAFPPGQQNP